MPYWYFDKKDLLNTPSFQDGIDHETESRYRKEGARFIIDTGSKMDLGYNTVATGVVYFHRFYIFHSFKTFPRYITACCCLFLAGKVEETPKKCKDIIKIAKSLLTEQKFATFGDDPKEEVMTLERILLQTIKFDLQVEHPYGYLLKYAKCLKGDKTKLQKMVQMAWTFVNDSLCTTLSLQWEPEVVAVALMFLAGKLSKFEVVDWAGRQPRHTAWWDMFVEDITMDLLEDICHQVLDLYSPQTQHSGADSPVARAGPAPAPSKVPPAPPPPAPAPVSRPASPPAARSAPAPAPGVPGLLPELPRPPEPPRFPFMFGGALGAVPGPGQGAGLRAPLVFSEPPPASPLGTPAAAPGSVGGVGVGVLPPVNVPPPNYFPSGALPPRPYYPPPP